MALPTRVNVVVAANWTGTSATTLATGATSATSGNLLVVAVGGNATAGQAVTGLTDTAGNTYVKVDAVSGPDLYREELWYAKAITGHASNVVTVTWSATVAYRGIAVVQYAGLDAAIPADGTAKGTAAAGGTTVTTGTLTTTRAETVQVILPRWGYYTADTITWPSGFSRITTGGDLNVDLAERFVSGTTAAACTITHTYTAIAKQALVAAFTATAAAPPLVALLGASQGMNGGTTGAIDTTGATLIIVTAQCYVFGSAPTLSDSKGNTYTSLTTISHNNTIKYTFYTLSPTVGAGHTFTISGSSVYNATAVHAFSGAWSFHQQNQAANALSPGTVTPTINGALVFTTLGSDSAATDIIPTGFAGGISVPFSNGVSYQISSAYLVQLTAAAINPAWTLSGSHTALVSKVVTFLPAAPTIAERAEPFVWMPV